LHFREAILVGDAGENEKTIDRAGGNGGLVTRSQPIPDETPTSATMPKAKFLFVMGCLSSSNQQPHFAIASRVVKPPYYQLV
jgi:hypothetical protein